MLALVLDWPGTFQLVMQHASRWWYGLALLLLSLGGSVASADTIAGGGRHTVVAKPDGTVWAWGWNDDGQLGDGSQSYEVRPAERFQMSIPVLELQAVINRLLDDVVARGVMEIDLQKDYYCVSGCRA